MISASNVTLARAENISICTNSCLHIELYLVIALLSLLLLLFIILYRNKRSSVRLLQCQVAYQNVRLQIYGRSDHKLDQISIAKDEPQSKTYENHQSIGPTDESIAANSHEAELNQKLFQ